MTRDDLQEFWETEGKPIAWDLLAAVAKELKPYGYIGEPRESHFTRTLFSPIRRYKGAEHFGQIDVTLRDAFNKLKFVFFARSILERTWFLTSTAPVSWENRDLALKDLRSFLDPLVVEDAADRIYQQIEPALGPKEWPIRGRKRR